MAASDDMQVLLFTLGDVYYGVDVHQVREIREVQNVTPVPYAPFYFEGVTNLRGEVIPVLNLRKSRQRRRKQDDGDSSRQKRHRRHS